MKLRPGGHFEWLMLRKVNIGRVTRKASGDYLDQGSPLGMFPAEIVAELLAEGLLHVDAPDPSDGPARVRLSEAGATRYSELCRRQRARCSAPVTERAGS